ncbi:energy transducer TonB [Roseicella aquatilis]|uniref:Energy transducer TonB n=1 Tax=Roseicella aquatilis TaxID=2527868 RepID=A0A4R4DVP1_9PROT|nr:energy transducer TonB [Roseicella aquatilis]TCZ65366.1 energy transducer TonB [Roseicella aquatilis]
MLARPAEALPGAGERVRPRVAAGSALRGWAPAASLLLHAAALGAVLLLLHRPKPPEAVPESGVEVVWDQAPTAAEQATGETAPRPGPPPVVESPQPPAEAASPPPAPPSPPAPPEQPPIEALAAPPEPAPPPPVPPPQVAQAAAPPGPSLPPPLPEAAAPVTLPPPAAPVEAAEDLPLPPPAPSPPPEPPARPAAPVQASPPPRQAPGRPAPAVAAPSRPGPSAPAPPAPLPGMAGGSQTVVTGRITGPGLLPGFRNPEPEYPLDSRRRGEQGTVRVLIRVAETGAPTGVEVLESSGFAALDDSARRAALRSRFAPATRDGVPIPGTIRTAYHFSLR